MAKQQGRMRMMPMQSMGATDGDGDAPDSEGAGDVERAVAAPHTPMRPLPHGAAPMSGKQGRKH